MIGPLYCCPECGREVLNRRVAHCLYCCANLPASFLLTSNEIARFDEQLARSQQTRAAQQSPAGDAPALADGLVDAIELVVDAVESVGNMLD